MNEDLQQQLMEFVYGLLEDDEANALCERITSDPDVARAYAKVKLQCDLVGRAARFDTPSIVWMRPDESDSPVSDLQLASTAKSAFSHRRLANWCIGVAACGLICLVGSTFWMSSRSSQHESTPVAFLSASPVQVVLTGPSKLNSEADNPFSVRVEDPAGTPVSTTLNYRLYDANGAVRWHDSSLTDQSGVARFDVNGEAARNAARLEVTTTNDSPAPIVRELEAAPERFVTYLRLDRPLYQPGEQLFYRSVTLSQYGLRAEREVATAFEIVNAADEQVAASANLVITQHGVGSGAFALPSDFPDGKYTLIARSPDNLFREEWRNFQVRRYEAPRLLKELELAQDSYTLGEQVDVDFSVARVAGKPLADVPLQVAATLDGVPLATPEAKTDAEGKSRFSLTLPGSIERGEAIVSVTVKEGDDPAETITKEIPINLGKVNVDFYPEGGDLAAELPTRVYFYGRDPLGKPVHIAGRVVDSSDNEVAEVVTTYEGRGVFSLTAAAGEQFRLMLDNPVGVTKELPLPIASTERFATLDTGAGVFAASAPVTFTLTQRRPIKPLFVAAYCRGAMVAQQMLEADDYDSTDRPYASYGGELTLPPAAQGVIRLTVFDATPTPAVPIAERLVYRRIAQQLNVQISPDGESFTPGQAVQLDVAVRDESDAPVPAALGIAIVDDAVLNLADDKSTRLPTYFHLLTEIDSPDQLEDANFYLSDKPDSVAALDSLLGTQGWRRFREVPATQLAQGRASGFGGEWLFREPDVGLRLRSLAWASETAIPLSTTAMIEVRKSVARQSSRSSQSRAASSWPLHLSVIVASIVVLVFVGFASLRWAGGNRSLRVFAALVALGSLLFAAISLPTKSLPTGRATVDAAPATTTGVAKALSESEIEFAANGFGEMSAAPGAIPIEGYMLGPDNAAMLPDMPATDAPMPSDPSPQDEAVPAGTARYGAVEKPLGRQAEETISKKLKDAAPTLSKESEPPPRPAAMAAPDAPQGKADALGEQRKMRAARPASAADKNEQTLLTREYADWFYKARPSISPTGDSSSTIFWHPLFMADESGKATVYFNLPQRPTRFRAIVEAHGADRLGAADFLINSREP